MEKIKTEVNGTSLRSDESDLRLIAKILSFAKVAGFPAPAIVPWAKLVNASVLNGSFRINHFRYGS